MEIMNNIKKLVILDFGRDQVTIMNYDATPPYNLDIYLEVLEEDDVISRVSDCNWILTENDIIIK